MRGGPIHTMVPGRPAVEALAVKDGRVVAAGRAGEAAAALGAPHRVVELGGRCVLPAFTDCHTHFASFASGLAGLRLENCEGPEEVGLEVVRAAAAIPPGRWVTGGGWDSGRWAAGRSPHRRYLDMAAPAHPVALASRDGHGLWVNCLALQMAGITAGTPDPPGGRIVREAGGEPTGLLLEKATAAVSDLLPPPEPGDLAALLRRGIEIAHRLGLAGIHVAEGRDTFRAFQLLRRRGELTLRVSMMVPEHRLGEAAALGLETGLGDDWLRVSNLKLFLDGSLGQRTADMLEPYGGETTYRGVAVLGRADLSVLVGRAIAAGWPCAVHAIGDKANRVALDVFAEHLNATRRAGLRHRVEHAQCVHPADIPRFARLGVVASVQPLHATSDRYLADRHWGARARWAYPFRSLLRAGAVLAMGSDVPVEPMDPLRGIYAAVTRCREDEPGKEPWYPEETLTVREAVEGYTRGAAWAAGEEGRRGSLFPGALADFVVLSEDILTGPPERILAARVDATVVGGRLVHGVLH